MGRRLRRLLNLLSGLTVTLALLLAAALVGVRLVGLKVFSVLSGSMEPTYHTGSLIYVKPTDPALLKTGDVITFMLDESSVATHRIVEVIPDAADTSVLRFRTKGDANSAQDGSLVHSKNVLGRPVFSIPWLGYFSSYIQSPPGTYIAVSVGALLILLAYLPDMLCGGEDSRTRGTKPKGSQIIISNIRRDSQE